MIYLLTGYFLSFFLPLFVSSWRAALFGLAGQAFFTALILSRHEGAESWSDLLQIIQVGSIRAIAIPLFLFTATRALTARREFNLLPPNLVLWFGAVSLIICGFWFGDRISPKNTLETLQIGTTSAAILISFFILAAQQAPLAQLVGALTLESGALLFESTLPHPEPPLIRFGLAAVYVWFVWVAFGFLKPLISGEAPQAERDLEVL